MNALCPPLFYLYFLNPLYLIFYFRKNALIKQLKNGTKKILVDWELKPDYKWGDGKPVTAKDFYLAWQIGTSPNELPFDA